jgi:hypothetical protein
MVAAPKIVRGEIRTDDGLWGTSFVMAPLAKSCEVRLSETDRLRFPELVDTSGTLGYASFS